MQLVSLIGEQPIPVLLPIRHLNPERNLLVYTDLPKVKKASEHLKQLLVANGPDTLLLLEVDAYQFEKTRIDLINKLNGEQDLVFNLTGGTKIMSIAAYEAARTLGARCVYYQTEGSRGRDQRSRLIEFLFDPQGKRIQEQSFDLKPDLISLDDYLRAHMGDYKETGYSPESGGTLEKAVHQAVKKFVDECRVGVRPAGVKDQVEMDLVIRIGNQVGVLEVKTGGQGSGKKAIDQLTTLAAREYFGTYTSRFLVTQPGNSEKSDAYRALAQSLNVRVIELQDYRGEGMLSQRDAGALRQAIFEILAPDKR